MTPLEKLFDVGIEILKKRSDNKKVSSNDLALYQECRTVVQAMYPDLKLSPFNPAKIAEPEPAPEVAPEPAAPAAEPEKSKFIVNI